jgi:exopolyphosphatase / guanosine-5'-triphosphate,3'-diphosphate pyrophosphatase
MFCDNRQASSTRCDGCYAERLPLKSNMQNGTRIAAVDLGSNSFRLEIAHVDHGMIKRSEYLKETVRQGNGLDADSHLSHAALQRGWDCLARFGERLAGFDPACVRVVATQTLREARNRDVFIERGQALLGFPIHVIPGREEARLIYLGVSHLLEQNDEQRLVVDIGGRSTEMILGQGYTAQRLESYRVGSVSWSSRYFDSGELTARNFEQAQIAASAVLDEALGPFGRPAWQVAYGSSGTVGAVSDVLAAQGWPADVLTRKGLDWLLERMLRAGHLERLRMEGIRDDRRDVMGGGLSILRALFDLLDIDEMRVAQGTLRHGVLHDMVNRSAVTTDVREVSIAHLAAKFNIDAAQAQRVSSTACHLLAQTTTALSPVERERLTRKLHWAAQLHEIGQFISHTDAHKHGAYILGNADAAGFSTSELERLGLLVLGHKGKLKRLGLDALADGLLARQVMALRLGVLLCHARRDPDIAAVRLAAEPPLDQDMPGGRPGPGFRLTVPQAWAIQRPQSLHLLQDETLHWQKTPWPLVVSTHTDLR